MLIGDKDPAADIDGVLVKQVLGCAPSQIGFDRIHLFFRPGDDNTIIQLEARLPVDKADTVLPVEPTEEDVPIVLALHFPEGLLRGLFPGHQDRPVAQVLGDGILFAQTVGFGSEVNTPESKHGCQDHDSGQHTQGIGQGKSNNSFCGKGLGIKAIAANKIQHAGQCRRIVTHAGEDTGCGCRSKVKSEVGNYDEEGRYNHNSDDEQDFS